MKFQSRTLSFLIFLLPLILISVSCTGNHQPDTTETIPSSNWHTVAEDGMGLLTVLYVPAEGFAYKEENGEPTGFTVALLEDFAHFLELEYNIVLELKFTQIDDWTEFYNTVTESPDGTIGMGNVTITEERRQELTFSPPYMTNIASLISHTARSPVTDPKEMSRVFSGLNALAFEGTLHEERLRNLVDKYHTAAEIDFAGSNDEIIRQVGGSDSYFAYIDIYNYWRALDRDAEIQRHGIFDKAAEQFGYIMPLSTSWEQVLTEYFEQNGGLLLSERYREIMTEHLGKGLTDLLIDAHREQLEE